MASHNKDLEIIDKDLYNSYRNKLEIDNINLLYVALTRAWTISFTNQRSMVHKNTRTPMGRKLETDLICKIMSKSMSIRNGKSLDLKEQQYIINSLFACKETMICPFNLKTYVRHLNSYF